MSDEQKQQPKHSPLPWWLGEVQTDRDEYTYDGVIWAPPSKEDQEAERSPEGREQGFVAEPYPVAKVDHQADAEFIARAVNSHYGLLEAAQRALDFIASISHRHDVEPIWRPLSEAVQRAKGG